MREEGVSYADDLEAELFPGRGGVAWRTTVETIYSDDRMQTALLDGLDAELDDAELDRIAAFFDSEMGRHIVALEVSARRALLDDSVEVAATEAWMTLEERGGPRWTLLEDFAVTSDLVESNVAGAMTANYAFYRGLVDGHAFDFDLADSEILADIWSQEPQIRKDTVDWVYSFTSLAYQPLSDEELAGYLDFMRTPEGQALNAALFTAFNDLFATISHEMGVGAARHISGQDI
jgi:hypothetical protein